MKIVIDMLDKDYRFIKNSRNGVTSYPVTLRLYEAIRNGTPILRGDEKLADTDDYIASHRIIKTARAKNKERDNRGLRVVKKD